MKLQSGSHRHQEPRETQRAAGAVRQTNSGFQIFLPALLPHLLSQELQRYDPLDVRLQPCVRDDLAGPAPYWLPDNLLFPARSTKYLLRGYQKRCAPNRGNSLRALANRENCDAWRVQSVPRRNGPPRRDHVQSRPEVLPKTAPGLMSSYPLAPL